MMGGKTMLAGSVVLQLAGCGAPPRPPAPGDIADIQRPITPNTSLAAPAGFIPAPDIQTRRYPVPAPVLLAAGRTVMAARPRTTLLADDAVRMRVDYVERSRVFGFPDIVLLQVLPARDEGSDLVVYSYSIQGSYDFGVNRRRVGEIVAAVEAALPHGVTPAPRNSDAAPALARGQAAAPPRTTPP